MESVFQFQNGTNLVVSKLTSYKFIDDPEDSSKFRFVFTIMGSNKEDFIVLDKKLKTKLDTMLGLVFDVKVFE